MKAKSLKLNAMLNAIKQCCTILFPLITFPYVSRVLGTNGYGIYSFSYSITNYFILLAALGINIYAIREGAKIRDDKNKISHFANQIFSINMCSVVVSYILMITLILGNAKVEDYYIFIIIQSITILLAAIGTDWINSIYEDYLYITLRHIGVQFIALIMMFIFVKTADDVWKYCLIATFASSGGNLLNIFYVRKYVKIKFVFNMSIKKHIVPLLVLFINAIAITIYANSDITMLGFYENDSVVGVYGFASKIYNILKQLINAIIIVSIPRISYIIVNNKKDYEEYMNKIFTSLIVIMIPIVIGMSLMSKEIIEIAGGVSYIEGSIPLKIISISTIFSIVGSLFSNCVLIPFRRENKCLQSTLISAITNILLNFIFIKYWGMIGAAITTIIAEFMSCILQMYFSRQIINIRKFLVRDIISPVIGGGFIVVVCLIARNLHFSTYIRFGIAFGGSIIVYLIILYIMRNQIVYHFISTIKRRME